MLHLPTAWALLISGYLLTQSAAGYPATTQYARRQHLEHLARRIGLPLEDVTGEHLIAYAGAQDWAAETRRGRRTTFRSFWTWAVGAGHTAVDAAAALPRVKPGDVMPRPCPEPVVRAALAGADDRVRLIMRLAPSAGSGGPRSR
jgi:integrase/recombinase XerC